MDPILGSALISSAGSILGGISGGKASGRAINHQRREMKLDRQLQLDFAQKGIRWRVEDARDAGIHPLAALGAQTHSFSPVTVGMQPDMSQANMYRDLGQDLSRAFHATQTANERNAGLKEAKAKADVMDALNLDNMRLQNQLLAARIKSVEVQSNPPMPSNLGAVEVRPSEITSRDPNQPALEAGGQNPTFKEFRFGGPNYGFNYDLPSQTSSEGFDAMSVLAPAYIWGHNVLKSFDGFMKGPTGGNLPALPKGYTWRWSVINQAWQAVKEK